MAHWCQFPLCVLWAPAYRCGLRQHPAGQPGTTRSLQSPAHRSGVGAPQGHLSVSTCSGESGRRAQLQGSTPHRTRPRLPSPASGRGLGARSPALAPFCLLSLSLFHFSRCGVDVQARWQRTNAALGEQPGTPEGVSIRLIFFSIFAASSLLDVRVGKMSEREAGDVGRRDGEPGIWRRVGPARLHTPGRRRRRKIL